MSVKNRENILTVELNLESLVFLLSYAKVASKMSLWNFFFFQRVTNRGILVFKLIETLFRYLKIVLKKN